MSKSAMDGHCESDMTFGFSIFSDSDFVSSQQVICKVSSRGTVLFDYNLRAIFIDCSSQKVTSKITLDGHIE